MSKYDEISTTILSTLGISVSLQDIQNVLSIILLIFSIMNALIVFIPKFVNKIKTYLSDKKLTKEEISDIIEDGKEIIDTVTNGIEKIEETIKEGDKDE